jgi:alkylated DNA repair dioxygenase AlkB
MKKPVQPGLFEPAPSVPEGFKYEPDFLSPDEEQDLVKRLESLPLKGFQFQGFVGNRRVVSYGWKYDFNERELQKAEDMPPFLLPLRDRAAAFAGIDSSRFQHAHVIEYAPGAGIGWHRDKAVFDEVVGVSFLSPCRFRFRRKQGEKWERAAVVLERRSAYLLSGPSRTEWEHGIPATDKLRYSITFRSFPGK